MLRGKDESSAEVEFQAFVQSVQEVQLIELLFDDKKPSVCAGGFFIAIFQNYIKPSPCKAGFPYTSRRGLEIYALCNGSGKPRSIFVPEPAILQFLLLFAGVRH